MVHPILAYADLMATGDQRNRETAGIIYEQHIARLVRKIDKAHVAALSLLKKVADSERILFSSSAPRPVIIFLHSVTA